ncbi:XRE family transcriptional regulator [Vallicoccus soli]|uniref:XRE family transcriptional regulator n=2 Tax=Vallicoccus soli TaxID=2339232 RepID=A0A3A3ZGK4_9ACTN|nr:XRE family transcriptional regulator [Vallicoccus soli]
MTLTELAAASGLTKGFLSRLERDLATASVAALVRVCDALGIAVGSLFEQAPPGQVVRAGEAPAIAFGGSGMVERLLTPRGERRLQAILGEVAPGGGSGDERYALPAQVELALVLEGALEVRFDDGATALGPGDALTFDPAAPHSFRSLRPDGPTRVLWVLAPALPDDRTPDLPPGARTPGPPAPAPHDPEEPA